MAKVDFKKSLRCYRAKAGEFQILEAPELQYLMVNGSGDPNTSPAWVNAVSMLFPIAYALKFQSKSEHDRDYVVMPLEALWWADDYESFTSSRDKSQWYWTAMIMVPEWTTVADFESAIKKSAAKKPELDFTKVRLESLVESLSVQTLHIGSYDDEAPLLKEMHEDFIPQNSFEMTGRHHEIYLSDARGVAPEKLRTILRQPVRRR